MEKLRLTLAESPESLDGMFQRLLKEPGDVTILVSAPTGIYLHGQDNGQANGADMDSNQNGINDMFDKKQSNNREFELHVMTHEEFVTQSAEGCGHCYVVKRVAQDVLRSITAHAKERSAERSQSPVSLEEIENLCLRIRMPTSNLGIQYVVHAVKLVLDDPDRINRITKDLYPSIAQLFNKTDGAVERAIRHAITNVWDRGNIGELNRILGPSVCSLENKPTNGEFIGLLATCFRGKRSRLN